MKEEELNETINPAEEAQQKARGGESLPEGHNPDLGTPDEPVAIPESENDLEKAQRETGEWRDKYFRLYADFDNSRKRTSRERIELLGSASTEIIKELLPIIDDFERAVKANEIVEDINAVKEGFVLIQQKLYKRLESKGLKPIEAKGNIFDTDFHEAITQIPAPTKELKGKVVDEVEKGYLLNDKVIRFSKVVIGQ
ncbi:MAG: nucleotide exchange factor GrpE [Flavobacteriales bacterium]|nr:nucleotide exchange factor GrpE [Flavobacteriales bacterium]